MSDSNIRKMRLITKPTDVENEGYSCQVMYHLSKRVHSPENRSFWLEILYYPTLQKSNTATYKKYQSYSLTNGRAQDID